MKFVFHYPDCHGTDRDMLDAGAVADVAAAAERAGWLGYAFTEHPMPGAWWLDAGGHQTLDPFVALGHAAAVTERMMLLTYIAVAPYRNPFLLAKAASTVDKLSGGRFVLGLGTGYSKTEYFALGVDFDERNDLFDEALEVLPLVWRGERFSYAGRHFEARDVIARPLPVQQPIPIWIGGNSKLTRRRVAERGQGWMPLFGSPTLLQTVRSPAVQSDEHLATLIAELRDSAGDRQVDVAVQYYDVTDPSMDVERHRDRLGFLEEIGATWVVVSPPITDESATLDFIEGFGVNLIG